MASGREQAAAVDAFYAAHPFPGYAPGDDARTLIDRSRASPFLVALDRALPSDATVVDCGCGTGQLGAFLALSAPRRRVLAFDRGEASLRIAREFRERARIRNLDLLRADLFDLPLPERAIDFVVCRGVVHHTPDPARAIERVARHVAPAGFLLLGFYEAAARLFHRIRRRLGAAVGRPIRLADPILRRADLDDEKRRAWCADQYAHPLERSLALRSVVDRLEALGLQFVRTIPPLPDGAELFDRTPAPSRMAMAVLRLGWLLRGLNDADAGLVFVVAQRRRDGAGARS